LPCRHWYSDVVNAIDGYDDIHDNVRFWMQRLTEWTVSRNTESAAKETGRQHVLFDIGSNDGEVTLPVVMDHRKRVSVVAFEPLPEARARLIKRANDSGLSVALWGKADVSVIPLALGDTDEMIDIDVYDDDTFSSLYTRSAEELKRYRLSAVQQIQVRMRPLDDLVASGIVPPPDVVKIDVEGAELAVLRGGASTLQTGKPPILMEYSCINTGNAGYDRRALTDELQSLGYTRFFGLYRNEDRHLYSEESLTDCRIWNILALYDDHGSSYGLTGELLRNWRDVSRP
jgi:FkbM family methyltransferase